MAKDHRRLAEEVAQGILLDDPSFLEEIVQRVLQELLEAEMRTRVGTLNLLVPQDREGTPSTRLFSRYQRNEKALVLALMEM